MKRTLAILLLLVLTATSQAATGLFVNDSFTDTSTTPLQSHTGETGATWAKNGGFGGGAAVISSANRLRGAAASTVYYASGTPFSNNYDVQADLTVQSITGSVGILGRENTTVGTYYLMDYEAGNTAWHIYSIVNGSNTASVSFSATLTVAQTYRMRLSMSGTTIVGYVNGVQVMTMTDSSVTAGSAGVFFSQSDTDSTGLHLDNFGGATSFLMQAITPSIDNSFLSPLTSVAANVGWVEACRVNTRGRTGRVVFNGVVGAGAAITQLKVTAKTSNGLEMDVYGVAVTDWNTASAKVPMILPATFNIAATPASGQFRFSFTMDGEDQVVVYAQATTTTTLIVDGESY